MIPKIFHNIWLGGKMPDCHRRLMDRMIEMHPGWEYNLWTDDNLPNIYNKKVFDNMNKLCFKADVLRYELILKYGGVYIDTDFLFLKNIDELLTERESIIVREWEESRKPNNINNNVIGLPPNHELMLYIVMKMEENYELYYKDLLSKRGEMFAGWETVGPHFFHACLRSFSPEIERLALPKEYFNPFRPKENIYQNWPKAYALHLWNHRNLLENIDIDRIVELQNVNTKNISSNLAERHSA